jgi:hypothetical protein
MNFNWNSVFYWLIPIALSSPCVIESVKSVEMISIWKRWMWNGWEGRTSVAVAFYIHQADYQFRKDYYGNLIDKKIWRGEDRFSAGFPHNGKHSNPKIVKLNLPFPHSRVLFALLFLIAAVHFARKTRFNRDSLRARRRIHVNEIY